MRNTALKVSLVFTLCIICSAPVFATQAGPAEQTLAMIDALKQVKDNDSSTYKKVDPFINYKLLTTNSIAAHRSKFSDTQFKKFTRLFESLIRKVAYPQSSSFYEEAKVTYESPVFKGDSALVISETFIEKEDFEMTIGYQWAKTNDAWKLSDLILDDDSLVKDYQNQFGRIIGKEGVAGLIKKIENKIADIDAEKAKK